MRERSIDRPHSGGASGAVGDGPDSMPSGGELVLSEELLCAMSESQVLFDSHAESTTHAVDGNDDEFQAASAEPATTSPTVPPLRCPRQLQRIEHRFLELSTQSHEVQIRYCVTIGGNMIKILVQSLIK